MNFLRAGCLSAVFFNCSAWAQSAECFRFQIQNTPEASAFSHGLDDNYSEKWCYQNRSLGRQHFILVFNADSDQIRPELTGLIRLDSGGHPQSLSAGFLVKGKVNFEALPELQLNPFPIPLTLQEARSSGHRVLSPWSSQEETLEEIFIQHLLQTRNNSFQAIEEGEFSATVPEENKPFNGFWWSHEGVPLASGPTSPLGLLDAYQQARGKTKSNAVSWEQANHSDTVVPWGGHCNGWAASAVLFPEPTKTLVDPLTHRMITPYAQKGMLAEASYCVNTAFYGNRYWGKPGDELTDIHPDLFHQTLLYYIQSLGRPVAMDYARDEEIDNHVISGYHFSIKKMDAHQFHVDAILTVHQYDIEQEDSIGQAVPYFRNYSYTLNTDEQGQVINGLWDETSDNPDFFWVPLSPSPQCGGKNPAVNPDDVSQLITSLPEAQPRTISENLSYQQDLGPQEQIPISIKPFAGDKIKIYYTLSSMSIPASHPTVYLVMSGDARYPVTDGFKESVVVPLALGEQVVTLSRLINLDAFAIVNRDLSLTNKIDLKISRIEFLGE